MPRDPKSPYPHTVLVYVDRILHTRIEVVETSEHGLEATCTKPGRMKPSAIRYLTRKILRAAMRIQGLTWCHDNDDAPLKQVTFGFRMAWATTEEKPPRAVKSPKKRNV